MPAATLLYFTAPWCAPCHKFLPRVRDEAATANVPVAVADIDTPEGAALALAHGIQGVPTVILSTPYGPDRFGVIPPRDLRRRLARAQGIDA